MLNWAYLTGAIVLEVSGTLALRSSVDSAAWLVLVVIGYVGSLVFLALVLRRGAPVGVVYGIWAACGVALTAILAAVLYGDPLNALMSLGIIVVIGGVILVEVGSAGMRNTSKEQKQ